MDASQITFPVGEKFYFLLFKRSRVSCDNSQRPWQPHPHSKQALLLNSQFNGEKEATISNNAGDAALQPRITHCSSAPSKRWLVRARSKCQARTMRGDKLLSPNSCTANFQLYTQMALRLEENGAPGENSSGFLCLFGSECGGGRMASWKQTLARRWPGSPGDSAAAVLGSGLPKVWDYQPLPSWVSAVSFFGLFAYTITLWIWELTPPSPPGLGRGRLGTMMFCPPAVLATTLPSPSPPMPVSPPPSPSIQLCSNWNLPFLTSLNSSA